MKELYSHKVLTSFYLWFDHTLLSKGEAYLNTSGSLYYTKDDRIDDSYVNYSSPFKQWVYDSSITGAQIPSGIYSGSAFITRDDGIKLDFDNGRIWADSSIGTDENFTAAYSVKNLNTYIVSAEEYNMIFEEDYQLNSRYGMISETGVSPYGNVVPACFIMNTVSDNKPFAFGGMQDTQNKFRVVIVADNIYDLDGCVSLFRDMVESNISLVSLKDDPFNEYGDLKSGQFNYETLAADNQDRLLFLDKVSASKITTSQESKLNPNLRYGIMDFYLSEPRVPKQDY